MLPLVVALNVAATLGVEDRTEVRGRAVQSPRVDDKTHQPRTDAATGEFLKNDSKTAVVLDAETDPVARLRVFHEDDAMTLAYAPRIALANFGDAGAAQGGKTTFDVIHRPLLTIEKQIDPLNRFVLNGLMQFGTTTPGTLLLPDRWNGEDRPAIPRAYPVLPFAKQTFLSIYAAAGVAHAFSPRLLMTISAFYITFGQPTQAGRIAAGGTTYLQNPGVGVEFDYKATATDTLIFNVSPQVNIVQATPVETDNDGNDLAVDGQLRNDRNTGKPRIDPATNQEILQRHVNRKAPNTYQVYLEARYRKQLSRLTSYELAIGANVIQQSIPQAVVPTGFDAKQQPTFRTVDNPFALLGRVPGTAAKTENDFNVLPVGEALLNRAFSTSNAHGRLIAFTRADAWLNTVSGSISARNATVAAVNLDFGLDALRAQIAFVQSLPLSSQTTFFRQVITEVSYERELTKSWFFDIGARAGYQDAEITKREVGVTDGFRTSFFQPGAFAGIAWRPLPAKL